MTDPAVREQAAREMLRQADREARYWAAERRAALWDLYAQHGTWPKVAAAIEQPLPTITKAAYKRPREDQP